MRCSNTSGGPRPSVPYIVFRCSYAAVNRSNARNTVPRYVATLLPPVCSAFPSDESLKVKTGECTAESPVRI